MASSTNHTRPKVDAALAQAIKRQVMDKLENTLDIEIPRAMRNALLKASPTPRTAPASAEADVHMPDGEKCAAIWHELDRLAAAGKPTNLANIRKIGERKGWNAHTTRIQFYKWRAAQAAH